MTNLDHRRATARLHILNPDGTPAAGREIRADQTSHTFLFGCGVFDAVALQKIEDPEKKAFFQTRMDKWLRLFNYGTLPFYWGAMSPRRGRPRIRRPWPPQNGCGRSASA